MPKKILEGTVISHKMDKTAVVAVKRVQRHPLYKKNVMRIKKYAAHDETNAYPEGAAVYIRESRPFSKTKKWEVISLASSEDGKVRQNGGEE